MSIVISNKNCSSISVASSYLDYLQEKSSELASYYAAMYANSKDGLETKFANDKLMLERDLLQSLELYEQKLNGINQTHMLEFINYLDSKLSLLIDKILVKVGIYNVTSAQISDLIRIELADLLKSRTVKVRANLDTINYLKFCVEINGFIDAYEEDDSIKDGSCIISDGMCVCSANISSVATKVKEIFKKG